MTEIKLFNKWESSNIKINDIGLKNYIGIKPVLVPKTGGRHSAQQFHKSNIHIVERLMNHMMCPGHRGKRHRLYSRQTTGKAATVWNVVKESFEIIERKTKTNPIEVLVRAVENAALREEITSFRLGGIMVRKAVIASPQRRVDLTMRLIAQTAFQKSVGKRKIAVCLADEIIACYNNDSSKAHAIKEKERIEREAAGAR